MTLTRAIGAGFLAAVATAGVARASAFAVEHQNARALGAAYAGAQARKADAGFLFYNPAAIAGVERAESSSSGVLFWGPARYRNASATHPGGAPVAGVADDDGVLPPAFIPSSAFAAPIGERLVFGLAMYAPFGLRSRYEPDSALRYHALESKMFTLAFAPTLAMALNEQVSIGGGLRIQYADLVLTGAIDAGGLAAFSLIPGFAPGSSDAIARLSVRDWGVGYTAGIQIEPVPGVRAGFNYASGVTHDLSGSADFGLSDSAAAQALNAASGLFAPTRASGDFALPSHFGLGLSVAADERLTLLASTTLTRWSRLQEVVFAFENPVQPAERATFQWSDSWSYSVGAEYKLTSATELRLGYMRDQSPVNPAFASPRIPDSDRNMASVGFSTVLSERMSADFGAAVVFARGLRVERDGTLPEDALRGALSAGLENRSYAVAGRLRYRF
jgi:long-chain fatty acid transport protein